MPIKGQQKGTPARRAEFIEHLRSFGPGRFCVNWPWSRVSGQYVSVHINGEKVYAHRWVYEQINGPLPKAHTPGAIGPVVMHSCDNRSCVRPSHLGLGTQQDNIQDAFEKGRMVGGSAKGHDNRRKLSEFDVASIKTLRQNGARQSDIAPDHSKVTDGHRSLVPCAAVDGPSLPLSPTDNAADRRVGNAEGASDI